MVDPGFADAVMDGQMAFRTVLDAMAAPGRVLAMQATLPPGPRRAARAVLLALADGATPVWLDGAAEGIGPWLRFHTGARVVQAAGDAVFALVADPGCCPPLDAFEAGSDAFPDRSATLLIEVPNLAEGGALRLRGPGIAEVRDLLVAGLPGDFWARWATNVARFPVGIDLVLTSGDSLAALPRTVSVEAPCMSR